VRRTAGGAAALFCLLLSGVARAQDPPGTPPTDGAVPRGQGGAVIQHPDDDKPKPKRNIADAIFPQKLNESKPVYPPEAEKAHLEGAVILALDIDTEGHVTAATVVESAGHGFDEAAVEAAKKLLFSPAHWPDGTPFAARLKYRSAFTLTPKEPAPPPAGQGATAVDQKKQAIFSGVVLIAGTDITIAGASVTITPHQEPQAPALAPTPAPAGEEARTDEKGAFTFSELAPGKYTVLIRAPGYKPLPVEETLAAGEATEVKYRLSPAGDGALEVTVEGERPPREVTKRTITQEEIERIPGTNGDALKSLQSLPGVARPPGLLGLLIVRGSAPQDTQTFIDGTPVPLIYHFGGLSSVVPTEVLSKIDFYPGNFGAEYGRVQGGIVDVGLRAPKSEYHGLVQADFIDARLMAEGPIPGLDGWTFLAAARRSYIGALLAPVLSAAGASVTEAPVYSDYQFMIAKKPTPHSSFRVTFFGSDDAFELLLEKPTANQPTIAGSSTFHTGFQRLQLHYDNTFSSGDRLNVLVGFGRDEIDFGAGAISFSRDFRSLSGRAEYSKKLGRGVTLDAGIDMYGGFYDVEAQLPPLPRPGAPPDGPFATSPPTSTYLNGGSFQPAVYLEGEISPDANTRIVPGIRLDYFNITRQFDFSPRVNARYDLHKEFPRTTLKAGVGLYYQQPQFEEVTAPFGTPDLKSNRSIQSAIGAEQEFTRHLEASLEGFYKYLDHQVTATASASGASTTYTNAGTGYVVGGELLVKYKPDAHFFGWIAYTLSRSIRQDGTGMPEYLFLYDQPHILTVLGSYNFRNGWEFGARFRLISGNLVSPNVCNVGSAGCDPNRTNALFAASTGTYTPIPLGGPASERLPLFHQLDLRVDRAWQFTHWKFSMYLDVQNAYNQANVEGLSYNFNYTSRQFVAGLPILPSLGMRGEF
jgi:TonB family protein